MREYAVKITERLSRIVAVQAENADAAEEKVQNMYRNSEIILTADNYMDTNFEIIRNAKASLWSRGA